MEDRELLEDAIKGVASNLTNIQNELILLRKLQEAKMTEEQYNRYVRRVNRSESLKEYLRDLDENSE